jgi:antitoxin component YwqK of YwqJK toxin-antitoxin module
LEVKLVNKYKNFVMIIKSWLTALLSIFIMTLYSQNDTINKVDENDFKQGYWVYYFTGDNKKEEGKYIDNKKEGLWFEYYESGVKKGEITYVRNRPNGYAKFYFENGNVSEEGIWKINKWVGEYKMYHNNGNLSYDWNYSDKGKRTGEQKYYHSNGKVMIKGDWDNGKEQGTIKHYDESGKLVSERTFVDGTQDPNSIKYYDNTNSTQVEKDTVVIKNNTSTNPQKKFDGNGNNIMYNKNRQKFKEGFFVNYKLKEGKKYFYDDDGNLAKILEIKNFKIVNIKYEE